MAYPGAIRLCFLSAVIICISMFCCNIERADAQGGAGGFGGGGGPGGFGGGGGVGGIGGGGGGGSGGIGGGGGGVGGVGSGGGGSGGIGGGGGGAGGIGGGGGVGSGGSISGDPAEIVAKALLCFNDKYIYSSCEEQYRLTQAGNINVPPEYVDEYCDGPCLTETHLVLNCIENIMEHFVFYNKATIGDIKATIKAGCGYGLERGDFDVAEHIQAEEDGACYNKANQKIILGISLMVAAGRALWF